MKLSGTFSALANRHQVRALTPTIRAASFAPTARVSPLCAPAVVVGVSATWHCNLSRRTLAKPALYFFGIEPDRTVRQFDMGNQPLPC